MRGEPLFIQETESIIRDLRNEIQEELWKPKPDSNRLNRLLRTQADLESAVCNLLGTMD
jgi:hypothetical protein